MFSVCLLNESKVIKTHLLKTLSKRAILFRRHKTHIKEKKNEIAKPGDMKTLPRALILSQLVVPYGTPENSHTFQKKGEIAEMGFLLIYTLNFLGKRIYLTYQIKEKGGGGCGEKHLKICFTFSIFYLKAEFLKLGKQNNISGQ